MSAQGNLRPEQFAAFTSRVRATGGATMRLDTGKMIAPGRKAYMVGGEKDSSGGQIPGKIVPEESFSAEHAAQAARDIHAATGGRGRVTLGGWTDNGKVYLDASGVTRRPGEAVRKGRNRGEIAIWNNRNMREINTGGPREGK